MCLFVCLGGDPGSQGNYRLTTKLMEQKSQWSHTTKDIAEYTKLVQKVFIRKQKIITTARSSNKPLRKRRENLISRVAVL